MQQSSYKRGVRLRLLVQGYQMNQSGDYFRLEANPGTSVCIATAQDQCLQVFHAIAVPPEFLYCQGNTTMVLGNDGHFSINTGLQGELVQRDGARRQVLFLPTQRRETGFLKAGVFGILHSRLYYGLGSDPAAPGTLEPYTP